MLPHISIKPEAILHFYGIPFTNSLLLWVIGFVFFLFLAFLYFFELKKEKKSKFFYFLTFVLRAVYGLFEPILGNDTKKLFPLIGGFFFYILIQNWFGLLPGVGSILLTVIEHGEPVAVPLLRSNSADLNSTLSLALIAFFIIQFNGIKELGFKTYMSKFINFTNPMNFFVGILETISEFSRILSFAFRLFGNIFAGEVILVVIAFLIPVLVSFPFLLFEVFVGLVQAFIFSMLAAVLIKVATAKPH